MKLTHIIDDLMLTIERAKVPNANRIDRRLLYQWINNQRNLWLSNEFNKGREFRNNEIQVLYDVELEPVNTGFPSTEQPDGIAYLKSTSKIPRTLQFQSRDGLIAIRSLDGQSQRFNYVSREQAPYSGNGIFNRGMIFFYKVDDYLWAKYGADAWGVNIPTNVRVEGIFEEPLDVDIYNKTIDNIWTGIDDYPMSARFVEYVKGAVLQQNFATLIMAPEDSANDDEHKVVTS